MFGVSPTRSRAMRKAPLFKYHSSGLGCLTSFFHSRDDEGIRNRGGGLMPETRNFVAKSGRRAHGPKRLLEAGDFEGPLFRSELSGLALTAVAGREFQRRRVNKAPRQEADRTSQQLKGRASEELLATLVRAPKSPSRVAAAIAAEIADGRLHEGDRLPTEAVLASRFGVSRSVVREAIAGLRSDGLVRSRQGLGTFVVSQRETATLRIDPDLMSDLVVFRNVFELRPFWRSRQPRLPRSERTSASEPGLRRLSIE